MTAKIRFGLLATLAMAFLGREPAAQDLLLVAPTPAIQTLYDRLFDDTDRNGDGTLSSVELSMGRSVFKPADGDRDGALSRFEFYAAPSAIYAALDVDHDGVLAFDEFAFVVDMLGRGGRFRLSTAG